MSKIYIPALDIPSMDNIYQDCFQNYALNF